MLSAGTFVEDGVVVSTSARSSGDQDFQAAGEALDPKPTVVLINRDTASAAEILAAALQDYGLATLVGTRTYGKNTVQEIIDLAAGGALDLTIGEYVTSEGESLADKGVQPDVTAPGRSRHPRRRGTRGRARRARARCWRADGRATAKAPERFVGVVAKRGKFRVVEPIFDPGPQVALASGDVRHRRDGAGGARGRPATTRCAELGSPKRAADVVGAMIWEAGLERGFAEPLEEEASRLAADAEAGPERHDLTALDTFTVDPATARDFDDAVSAQPDGDGLRLWIHIADVAAHVRPGSALEAEAYSRGTSVYVPGTVEPMLPAALSGRRLQPRAGRRAPGGDHGGRSRRDGRAPRSALLPQHHPLGREARLRPARPRLRRSRGRARDRRRPDHARAPRGEPAG